MLSILRFPFLCAKVSQKSFASLTPKSHLLLTPLTLIAGPLQLHNFFDSTSYQQLLNLHQQPDSSSHILVGKDWFQAEWY